MTDDGEVKTRSRGPHRGVGRPRLPSFKETVDTADKIFSGIVSTKNSWVIDSTLSLRI